MKSKLLVLPVALFFSLGFSGCVSDSSGPGLSPQGKSSSSIDSKHQQELQDYLKHDAPVYLCEVLLDGNRMAYRILEVLKNGSRGPTQKVGELVDWKRPIRALPGVRGGSLVVVWFFEPSPEATDSRPSRWVMSAVNGDGSVGQFHLSLGELKAKLAGK